MPLPIKKSREKERGRTERREAPEARPPKEVKPEIEEKKEIPTKREKEKVVEKKPPVEAEKPPAAPPPSKKPPAPAKSKTLQSIENIMEEDVAEVYHKMSPKKQEEFKKKGEETASKIEKIIKGAKVKAKKIMDLIVDWLKIIPGVNKYFLRKEAKIKTEKILKLKEQRKLEKREK